MTISLYSKDACVQCDMTKKQFKAHGIDYIEINMSDPDNDAARQNVIEMGYLSAPVVVVNDDLHWSGFRPDRIKDLARNLVA